MKNLIKKAIKSKTIIFSFLVTIFGVIQTYMPYFIDKLGKETYGIIMIVIGIVIAGLRAVTDKPLSEKQSLMD